MKKIFNLGGSLFALGLLLSACNLPGSLPLCPSDALLAPVLVSPSDGGSVASISPTLTWAYPDAACNPAGYRIDLSVDESFSDTSLSGGTGNPSTSWGPGSELENCQVYHWRVAAINDTTLGPFSAGQSFRVEETGSDCPPVAPPPSASIGGIIWHDLCATPFESGGALPAGCVTLPDGGMQANGIREPGEPGIANVEVRLHFGACTDPVVATQRSGSFGEYVFDGILAFGAHCVSIDSTSEPNASILIPGSWTFPMGSTGSTATANANLESGSNIQQDFGWDYQLLPAASTAAAPTAAASTPAPPPLSDGFNVTVGANCRQGPDTVYDVVVAFPAGTSLRVLGRNAESSWWLVEINSSASCWISNVTGKFIGNPGAIQVVAAPPTPTPGAPTASVTPTLDPNATPTPIPTEMPTAIPSQQP
ncbi:MAG: hypothetical protein RBS68_10850 [Anaerolineales bacterium]|jgi:hypothetical protein|nr:hypothetical protein [Anaerolineales bacterium]